MCVWWLFMMFSCRTCLMYLRRIHDFCWRFWYVALHLSYDVCSRAHWLFSSCDGWENERERSYIACPHHSHIHTYAHIYIFCRFPFDVNQTIHVSVTVIRLSHAFVLGTRSFDESISYKIFRSLVCIIANQIPRDTICICM